MAHRTEVGTSKASPNCVIFDQLLSNRETDGDGNPSQPY